MTSCAAPTVLTAERFLSSAVRLVRSHGIATVEIFSPEADSNPRPSATAPSAPSAAPSAAAATARLSRGPGGGAALLFRVRFAPAGGRAAAPGASRTRLSAWWCAALQRRLAVCSALTGRPTRLSVSLAPFVPPLSWERGADGVLGAMHCAVMSATLDERHGEVEAQRGGPWEGEGGEAGKCDGVNQEKERGKIEHKREYTLQAALLLNANIPLGPRALKSTAVLVLHAPDGELCTAESESAFSSVSSSQSVVTSLFSSEKEEEEELQQRQKKMRCETMPSCDSNVTDRAVQNDSCRDCNASDASLYPEDSFYALISQFTAQYILPALSWGSVWSHARPHEVPCEAQRSPDLNHPLSRDESNDTLHTADNDVCGLGKQLGCSFYLDGSLDPRHVRSITVIINIPRALWHRLMPWLRNNSAAKFTHNGGSAQRALSEVQRALLAEMWKQLPRRVADTVEGALTRLAAENLDCFVHCAGKEGLVSDAPGGLAEENEEETEKNHLDKKKKGSGGNNSAEQSWQLLAQSIADSLAHIVRSSKNSVFVEEVHRLLQPAVSQETEIGAAFSSTPSPDTTAALLRWAVETRLKES